MAISRWVRATSRHDTLVPSYVLTVHTQRGLPETDGVRPGVAVGWPLLLPTAALAVSFGVTATPVFGAVATIAMSVLVFSGAAQFAVLGVVTAGGSALTAVATGLLVNARFLPMSLALAPSLSGRLPRRLLYSAALVDASWALSHRGGGRFFPGVMLGATLVQYAGWVLGTAVGVVVHEAVDTSAYGLDAVLPAFYLALLVPELRGLDAISTALLAGAVTLVLLPFTAPGVPVLVAALAALVGLVRR